MRSAACDNLKLAASAPQSHDVEHRSAPSSARSVARAQRGFVSRKCSSRVRSTSQRWLPCPGRAKRDPGPRGSPTVCRVALGPGSSLADARSSGTRGPRARRCSHPRDAHGRRLAASFFISRCQTAQCCSFPRRVCCARVVVLVFRVHPRGGVGGAPTGALCSVVAFARRDGSAPVRRGASHDAGRSPLGAPPWRFSAGGRASISGIASGSVQRAPRSQVVMPGGRCPGPPEPAVTSRGRRTPLPAPPSGSSPETPLHERGWQKVLYIRYVVK